MKRFATCAIAGCLLLATALSCVETCLGQGVLIVTNNSVPAPLPRPAVVPRTPPVPIAYKIKELAMHARITDQVARVQVTQSFVNTGSSTMEVRFCFPLPYDGAIDSMTFMADGKEYDAKLLPANEAREIYLNHIRHNQDPALLEWIGTGMFQTSVFPVPPGAERKVTIQLSQLLRKTDRLTDFSYPLSTARYTSQAVEKLSLSASIESAAKIKSVYSPAYAINVERPDDARANVKYEATHVVPTADFRLFFDTAETEVGASLVSFRPSSKEDGYFLLLASPEVKAASAELPSKSVIFVVDRSGSMSGKKIEQAKEALRFVLNNLRERDLFNIVAYDNSVESYRPELQRFDDASRKSALGFVESIHAGGSTNISDAMTTALRMIQDPSQPNFIVFLTDGLPTAGETNEMKISELVRQNNSYRTRIVSFGVGYDVNSRLLDRITRDNFGQSEFVRPDEDIELHVSRLFQRMSAPLMTDIQLAIELDGRMPEQGPVANRVYPRQLTDLFAGEQLVLVGRYNGHGSAKVTLSGSVGKETSKTELTANLVEVSGDQNFAFVESLWAVRRVGEIIDELDMNGKNEELIKELVELATQHGIITPYTSFLADETSTIQQLADVRGNVARAGEATRNLQIASGQSGFDQRAAKKSMREANQAPSIAGQAPQFGGINSSVGRPAGGLGGSPVGGFERTEPTGPAVQNVANQTLYKRGNIWVAENAKDIALDKDQSKIQVVKRFSDEYFELVAANTSAENAVLASQQDGQELLVNFRGQFYHLK